MAAKHHSRADDERLLDWLRLSEQGVGPTEIADLYDTTKGRVAMAVARVRAEMTEQP